MSPLPGTTVTLRETAPPRSAPTDTGVWFVAGFTEKGPLAPVLITSMAEYDKHFGARVSYGLVYDALDTYFREGGARAYVSRVVGTAPLAAFVVLNDAAAAATLRVQAKTVGEWGNALNIAVTAGDAGGEFKLVVSHDTLGTLETSPSFATKAQAIEWAQASSWITLIDQASVNDPAVIGTTSLAGGTDDRATAVDAHWKTALDRFSRDLGPGQVSMPGRTTVQSHADQLAHAATRNRFAILDAADSASKTTLVTAATNARTVNARYGAIFAPWAVVPGILPRTTRIVPYSAVEAGIMARNDARFSPNVPAAGELGQAAFATGLSQVSWSDADREELNNAGVNVAIDKYGGIRTYGYRTLADPDDDANYLLVSNMRLLMSIVAEGDEIAERYVFRIIDGAGHTFADFAGDLTGMLIPYYNDGSLYGATPEDAFYVDVGPQVNTPATIAALELHAVLSLRVSPFGERVVVELVKKAITEEVS